MVSREGKTREFLAGHDVRVSCLDHPTFSGRVGQIRELLETGNPDITVSDAGLELWWALRGWRPKCRISILRCEVIRGYRRRNLLLRDKYGLDTEDTFRQLNAGLSKLGLSPVESINELVRPDVVRIPSIPALDLLADRVHEYYPDTTFVYTGPLLLTAPTPIPESLQEWLGARRREGTPVVLVTLGTVYGETLYRVLAEELAGSDLAVVMVVPQERERKALEQCSSPRFQVIGFTDLQILVENADAVVHHCGHGTLHAVLLAGKPSVTIGSGDYDREDNAVRLEELGGGRHLSNEFFRKCLGSSAIANVVRDVLQNRDVQEKVRSLSSMERKYLYEGPAELLRVLAARGL